MTGRKLLAALSRLTNDQLDNFDLSVSSGCDANGNAEFFTLTTLVIVGDGTLDASIDGFLEEGNPILIFDEFGEDC